MDQENLGKKIEECKRESQEDFFTFDPCAQVHANFQQICDNGDDDDMDSGKEGLLFFHQTKWQRRLLNRYGTDLSLLYATYRTPKYALQYHCFS